jgi:aminoglycoside N3'-acetyltransferase
MIDFIKLAAEYLVRRIYFKYPFLVNFYKSFRERTLQGSVNNTNLSIEKAHYTIKENVPLDSDIMLHCSMAGCSGLTPHAILSMFEDLCINKNLLLPTHPLVKMNCDGQLAYSVKKSISSVGLVSELARRRNGFIRSQHPISTVAVKGDYASEYLKNNLNESSPLPHGINSPYYRLAERNGYVVCLGVPFIKCLTMMHVAEEFLDDRFPLKGIFESLEYSVESHEGTVVRTVRRRKPSLVHHLSMNSIRRELIASGAVSSFRIEGLIIDIVDARRVVDVMTKKGLETGFPYMFYSGYE